MYKHKKHPNQNIFIFNLSAKNVMRELRSISENNFTLCTSVSKNVSELQSIDSNKQKVTFCRI